MALVPDLGAYEAKRRSIADQYTADSTANTFGRFVSQQRGQRGLNDFQQGFRRQYPSFGASFAPRGMAGPGIRSGVMRRSMQNFVGDYNRDLSRGYQDLASNAQQYDMEQARLDSYRNRAYADLEMEKMNEIARAAQNLEALRPLLGNL